jgi:hypothetical protein
MIPGLTPELQVFPTLVSNKLRISKTDYQAQGVLFIPERARFSTLLNLPEGADIGKALNEAMKAIETENGGLKDAAPTDEAVPLKSIIVRLLDIESTRNPWTRSHADTHHRYPGSESRRVFPTE